jgi:hypothetical protein
MRIALFFNLFFFSFLMFIPVWAETFSVGNVTEFQNALTTSAANNEADTILVSADTYNVTSTLTYSSSESYSLLVRGAGASSTFLDGGDSNQILWFRTTVDNADLVLQDMAFQHGNSDHGGGIHLGTNSASINLGNCDFNDNTADYVGGGANLYSNTGEITVTHCTFRRNSSPNPSGYPYGTAGGLFIQTEGPGTDLRVANCVFEENTCQRDAAGAMLYPLGLNASMIVENNTFNNNIAEEFGGGCFVRMPGGNSTVTYENNLLTGNSTATAGDGGGSYFEVASGTLTVSDNIHNGNTSVQRGGGVWVELGSGTIEITDNTFTDNGAVQNGGGVSIFLDDGTMVFSRNVVNSNTSEDVGGGLSVATTSGALTISNNTFYGDSASEAGGIYFYFDQPAAQADVFNNILWHESTPAIAMSGAQTTTLTFTDCEGGTGEAWFGTGCIDADPLFENPIIGNFQITWANFPTSDATKSPCIDTGDPASPNDPDGTIADMGVFFFNQSTGIGNDPPGRIIKSYGLHQNYPNPFNPSTTIAFDIPGSSGEKQHVELTVYDIRGRRVKTLLDSDLESGSHKIHWDGRNDRGESVSSGIYLYTLKADAEVYTRKMTILK